jgi:hypothetical protein
MSKFEHAKFKFAETSNVTEVGISCWPHDGSGDATSERVVFGTPLVLKAGDEVLMVMARRIVELEAQVDALMLEYCPDEMTDDQVRNWGKHQVPEAAIKGENDE